MYSPDKEGLAFSNEKQKKLLLPVIFFKSGYEGVLLERTWDIVYIFLTNVIFNTPK